MAFAQLAEECRRAGDNDEAVGICRAGLAFHHDYLSARVTLGRALVELGRLDEAETELKLVLTSAPDNLPANRALAEIYQQRGQMAEALELYKRALQLAKYDPDLEHAVERIEHVVSPPPPPAPKVETPAAAVEDLFDFDTLLEQLGGRTQPKEEMPLPAPPAMFTPIPVSPIDAVELREDDQDSFSVLERQLRDSEEQRMLEERAAREHLARENERREQLVLQDLEEWLSVIVTDRRDQQSA
jgi:tetratricopeptide (TPR) repeat protein